jgi:hypothetical protein
VRSTVHLALLGLGVWPLAQVQSQSPGTRSGAVLTSDPSTGRIFLYGGLTRSSSRPDQLATDLWVWDGTWHQLGSKAAVPSLGRLLPHLGWDPGRRRLVMFGGRRESSKGTVELPDDIWEMDGNRWYPIESDSLSLLHGTLAPAPSSGRLVLYGGLGPAGVSRALREWNGHRWEVLDRVGPPVTTEEAFPLVSTFLPSGDLLIVTMHSGRSSDSVATRAWRWTGTVWIQAELGPAITSLQPAASAPDGTIYIYQMSAPWLQAPILHTRSPSGHWTQVLPPTNPPLAGIPAATYDTRRGRFVLYADQWWQWTGTNWEATR